MLGCTLPRRNHNMKNAGIPGITLFTCDNNDIKIPYRLPITEECHDNAECPHRCWLLIKDFMGMQYQIDLAMRAVCRYTVGTRPKCRS